MTDVRPFLATAIGSLPHTDPDEAVRVVLDSIADCPIWPQLPKRGLQEQMEIQYSEGLPCAVIDKVKGRMFFDTSDEDTCAIGMGEFYEKYMASEESGDWSPFAITEEFSAGIYGLLRKIENEPARDWLKVQTTGPVSIGLSVVDEQKRAIYYNDSFRDVIVKGMIAKCKWQLDLFRPYSRNFICFVDEPILSAFGSSTYVSVVRDDIVAILGEMVEAIHGAGALCGVHCCGNTEWPIMVDAGVDIINFDAFGFGETIALYPQQIKAHLESGRYLAWGLVPTSDKISGQTAQSLCEVYDRHVDDLVTKGLDRDLVHQKTIITPSCGTGSLPVELATQVFARLKETSAALQGR